MKKNVDGMEVIVYDSIRIAKVLILTVLVMVSVMEKFIIPMNVDGMEVIVYHQTIRIAKVLIFLN